jgi:hypothetical protein
MANVTREEMMEKYGEVELTFSSYYKYSFTFTGTTPDGIKLMASFGGHAEEIYRREVAADTPETLRYLDPSWLCASDAEGNKIGEWWTDSW